MSASFPDNKFDIETYLMCNKENGLAMDNCQSPTHRHILPPSLLHKYTHTYTVHMHACTHTHTHTRTRTRTRTRTNTPTMSAYTYIVHIHVQYIHIHVYHIQPPHTHTHPHSHIHVYRSTQTPQAQDNEFVRAAQKLVLLYNCLCAWPFQRFWEKIFHLSFAEWWSEMKEMINDFSYSQVRWKSEKA